MVDSACKSFVFQEIHSNRVKKFVSSTVDSIALKGPEENVNRV